MKNIFLLDMDDTLLDFPRAERLNFSMALEAHGVADSDALYARFHAINDGLWRMLERGEIGREELKCERFRLLFAEFGIAADPGSVSAFYFDHFPALCFPFEGAEEFLRELSRRGRVYITTNGGAKIQRSHISLAGFWPYLAGVFISEELGADKPSEAYVEAVRSGIENFEPASAVYIGDSLTSDMVCAERLGVDFILFRKRGRPANFFGNFASDFSTALRLIFGDEAGEKPKTGP